MALAKAGAMVGRPEAPHGGRHPKGAAPLHPAKTSILRIVLLMRALVATARSWFCGVCQSPTTRQLRVALAHGAPLRTCGICKQLQCMNYMKHIHILV